jgi:hypothetical protein
VNRADLVIAFTLSLLAAPLAAEAQPAGKIPRIGILRPGSPPDPLLDVFRQGLRNLGYDEGRNVRNRQEITLPGFGPVRRTVAVDARGGSDRCEVQGTSRGA